jgi:MFS family permease
MAVVALVTWWSCSAFIPVLASFLASDVLPRPPPTALALLKTEFITTATTTFNLGGLIGTLSTVPIAEHFGRRRMFLIYFAASVLAILATFGLPLGHELRLMMMFTVGLSVFGVFGSFTFYLPELFPSRLRGTGSGFCYNAGRYITAAFPLGVAYAVTQGINPLTILTSVAVAPLVGVILVLWGVGEETKGREAELTADSP